MTALFEHISLQAHQYPQREAVVTAQATLSYAELQRRIELLSASFMQLNLRRLTLWGVNSIDWIVVDLAAQKAGMTVIPVPLFFTVAQVRHLLSDSQTELLCILDESFCAPEWLLNLAQDMSRDEIFIAGQLHARFFQLEQAVQHSAPLQTQQPAKITYTSGSTGTPKGVCLVEDTIESITHSFTQSGTGQQSAWTAFVPDSICHLAGKYCRHLCRTEHGTRRNCWRGEPVRSGI
ncbi:AMP-binding protein [Acinetobacter lwoffii]|nr:AMP-binding protein [Acinetobacter lwoffii]